MSEVLFHFFTFSSSTKESTSKSYFREQNEQNSQKGFYAGYFENDYISTFLTYYSV